MVHIIGKRLFPNATRGERKRYARDAVYWLIACAAIVAAIVALECFMYSRMLH
jgi:hypothetical protein